MNAILLSDRNNAVNNVYSRDVLDFLKTEAGLDETVYTGADVRNDTAKFRDVRYIFSTWGFPVLSEEEVRKIFPSLECVFYAAGTVQYFARPLLKSGVRIFSAWAANAVPVAEYTVAQIILANKGFYADSRYQSKGELGAAAERKTHYIGNFDANIGIIGAGMIGKRVIRELKRHDLNVFVFDPFLPESEAEEFGVVKCDLPFLFENCRVISNHLADNEKTKGMLDGKLFEKMPPYATFINTGRGAQVVESELADVLEKRQDLTAVLDVTEPEPPIAGSPFYSLENCVLTPHIAGSIGNEVHRMSAYMRAEYLRYVSGEKCLYEVTEKMLETMA